MEKLSSKPAEIARYEGHGSLVPGALANFALVDDNKHWIVSASHLRSKSKNTPFADLELPLPIVSTYFKGTKVFERASA